MVEDKGSKGDFDIGREKDKVKINKSDGSRGGRGSGGGWTAQPQH